MSFDFVGLTQAQQALLTFQGWQVGDSHPQPRHMSAKHLVHRGLVIEHKTVYPGRPPITVREYEVPRSVHMAWCAFCSEGL